MRRMVMARADLPPAPAPMITVVAVSTHKDGGAARAPKAAPAPKLADSIQALPKADSGAAASLSAAVQPSHAS
jgi:hypothetical protein